MQFLRLPLRISGLLGCILQQGTHSLNRGFIVQVLLSFQLSLVELSLEFDLDITLLLNSLILLVTLLDHLRKLRLLRLILSQDIKVLQLHTFVLLIQLSCSFFSSFVL